MKLLLNWNVVAAELYHGYSILWSCGLNLFSCVKLFMWRTKINFWYMKLLDELDLVGFYVVVVLVDSFGRKRGFRVKSRCLSVFENKWLCEVLEIYSAVGSHLVSTTVYPTGTTVHPVLTSRNVIFRVFVTFKAFLWVPNT